MDENVVREQVRKIIVELAPVAEEDISPSCELSVDLGYESLRMMELATHLEDHFGIDEIPEEEAVDADTVGDVEELVLRLLSEEQVQSPA